MLLKTSLRSFFAHKGRMMLSLMAIVLSVAFVSGTLVFSNTATGTFDKLFATTASDISVQPQQDKVTKGSSEPGKLATVPLATAQKIAALPGVKTAVGEVFTPNATLVNPATDKQVGPTSGAPTITGNWVDTPRNSLEITSGHVPQGPGQIVLDADTAKKAGLGLGSALRVITDSGSYDFAISGIATFKTTNPGAALAFVDTATAQRTLLGSNAYTSVEVYGDGSRSNDQLKADALSALGSGYLVKTAQEQKADNAKGVGSFLDFMKYAMLGFAGISLLVGGFLIINTFSMLVAQRTREIGLLRAIGGSRRQVNRSVLVEALILGVLGSTLGLGAGLGLAVLLIQLMKAVGMNLAGASLEIGWSVPVAAYAVGIVITVLAAWIPARRAGRISPMAALRDHGTPAEARANRIRAVVGLVLTLGGAALLLAAASATKAATGGAYLGYGVVLSLIGFVVLGPLLATTVVRLLGAALPKLFGPSGRLAQRNAMRNPRRTGATAAALMIGLALVTGASVFTSSMVSSTSSQIDKSVGADYIVTSNRALLTPAMVTAAKSTAGLAHLTEQKSLPVILTTPDGATTETSVAAVSPTFTTDFLLPVKTGTAESVNTGGISVDETFAAKHHLSVGDKLAIEYSHGRKQSLAIGLITAKGNSLFDGNFFTAIDTVGKAVPASELPSDVAVFGKAADGTDKGKAQALSALQDSLKAYPQLTVKDQAGYKAIIQGQVNSLLYMIYGLLGLAIVVAVLGVVNTLALSVVERTREIGLLRAIGLSRRQLRRMIRLESVVIAVFGALLGTGLGLAWGITAQRVLSGQGLAILTIPTGTIVVILLASALVGLLAALFPAFRAGRMNVLAAIATD
ncbi:FtsX-like permease family protein [Kitasatospora sp. MAP5-34]|uniref:ABC transporter permease n=1 Tax=Kitasatospora sp. MAP5-34 TaxID=3035102 RepID=UPI0024740AED|nr:FtsX-like permease family protein [Kitasatospora sp. MAP5-34]MDH6580068.1 putative ABC transport system permease protein [Kitasatospora sp. MAP5-34]